MFIKFISLEFQNIMNYGSNISKINFEIGLTLINGKNGAGKSTWLDALSFNLFGKPYRKITKKELINDKNNKKLLTKTIFNINNDTYELTRGMKPDVLKIVKNDNEINKLHSNTLTQDEIDKILGVNYNTFKNIISLATNNNTSFLTMEANKKRELVESLFNIKIFGEMLKILKKENTTLNVQNKIETKNLSIINNDYKSYKHHCNEVKENIKNFENQNKNDIANLVTKIDKIDIDKIDIDSKIKGNNTLLLNNKNNVLLFKEEIKKLNQYIITDEYTFKNKLEKINKYQYELSLNIKNLKSKINYLNENSICTKCNQKIDEEYKKIELNKLNININELELKLEKLKKIKVKTKNFKDDIDNKIKMVNEISKKIEDIKYSNNKYSNSIDNLNNKLLYLDENKKEYQDNIKNIKNRSLSFDIEKIKTELLIKKEKVKNKKIEYDLIRKNISINKDVGVILSDSGIKSYFYKEIIPLVNNKINYYLNKFELPLTILLDETMNETITYSGTNKKVSYYSRSEGEKKKIDISFLLSFIFITKLISNWNCNLLIFDELLDSSIDSNGLDNIIRCLNDTLIYDSICVYIISHRLNEENNIIKRNINIEMKNGFSVIKNIK